MSLRPADLSPKVSYPSTDSVPGAINKQRRRVLEAIRWTHMIDREVSGRYGCEDLSAARDPEA